MKSLIAIFFSVFLGLSVCSAQNYYHVLLDETTYRKEETVELLDQLAQQFGIRNSTFSVRMTGMPKGTNATIDYVKVDPLGRHMFLIMINRFHRNESITTSLIHEMVHAKQYYHEELVRYDKTDFMWNGIRYRNIAHIEHHRRPWEIEAHQLAQVMEDYCTSKAYLSLQKPLPPMKKVILAREEPSFLNL